MVGNRPSLRVEGKDDENVILHLLKHHDIALVPPNELSNKPCIIPETGVENLLASMPDSIMNAPGSIIGFVMDADIDVNTRWSAVRNRLSEVGLTVPEKIPVQGYIDTVPHFNTKIGVWLMPDNVQSGILEDFLFTLIPQDNSLLALARKSTDQAVTIGAEFSDNAKPKAVLHTWLAWQGEPGKPYGLALKAQYFDHNSEDACAFVKWFKRLCDLK